MASDGFLDGDSSEIEPLRSSMSSNVQAPWFHSNRYSAQAACEHCDGVVRHESWCITRDPIVYYAYQIVVDPSKLTVGDALILHSLGVTWEAKPCQGNCKSGQASAQTPKS
jgi:hypothetical protein